MTGLYDQFRSLPVAIDGYELDTRVQETSSGFTRTTTTVSLYGGDHTGRGEDVSYDPAEHDALADWSGSFPLRGTYAFDEFASHLGEIDLFPATDPERSEFRNYRRWAFESAALDLALKQSGESLSGALEREYRPVRFVVSTRLGEPADVAPIERWLEIDASLEFKLDATANWTPEVVDELVRTEAVVSIDLKGLYGDSEVAQAANLELYELVLEAFPETIVEDPAITPETRPLFEGHESRVAWDYPITGVESIHELPWAPRWLNIKPSRFGSVQSVLETIEYCVDHEIHMFGGGQFELGVGREHLHALASIFYPDSPNDVAPREYNAPTPQPGLSRSPLEPPADVIGLDWPLDQ